MVCCPTIYYNTAVTGTKSCGSAGICAPGAVAANAIASFESVLAATAIAQGIADAQTLCCPTIYYNTAVNGTKSCDSAGICAPGAVAANSIPSWNSVIEATAIAQGIANALTVCCSDVGGGGGDTLPECDLNSLLYYDGTDWQCIPPPSGSGLHV